MGKKAFWFRSRVGTPAVVGSCKAFRARLDPRQPKAGSLLSQGLQITGAAVSHNSFHENDAPSTCRAQHLTPILRPALAALILPVKGGVREVVQGPCAALPRGSIVEGLGASTETPRMNRDVGR